MLSIADVHQGDVLWARARGYWRQVRVLATTRKRATVAYYIHATSSASASLKIQDLPAGRFRRERPVGYYGVVDVAAPPASTSGDRS